MMKITYEYDALGRIIERNAIDEENEFTSSYSYVDGGYGTNSTTPLVKSITQQGICFDYAYDNRGNIVSEKRYAPGASEAEKMETTYAYDALGQLVRVNDPHENATWVYTYDRGGNILNKTRYAFTTGTLGAAVETIPYTYGDSNWKDKLTAFNGIGIVYDEIGNPIFDGERTYTWGAGRQLRHISMPATGTSAPVVIENGTDAGSETMLQIVWMNETTLEAHVIRGDREITAERPASAFNWMRDRGDASSDTIWNAAHAGMKQVTLTAEEIAGNTQFACTYFETAESYGTIEGGNDLIATHTPAAGDANHVFTIENGMLKVESNAAAETHYELRDGVLMVNRGFTGTITSTITFSTNRQTKEIDFVYDHNGMRTRKQIVENGVTTKYEYTLNGKLITHMTVSEVEVEDTLLNYDELHFYYDAQSRVAIVKYNGDRYRYVHNLQGDIVGIVDGTGTLVVEYKYDAWGKLISTTGPMANTLGKRNLFFYRGYVRDGDTAFYYLLSRYYCACIMRFVSPDVMISPRINENSLFAYCSNNPVNNADISGLAYFNVTLNIYNETYGSNTYGHYDVTLIQFNSNNKEIARKTISYGPSEENGSDALITIYNGNNPKMEDHLYKSLVIYDDISEEEMAAFYEWFTNEFAGDKYLNSKNHKAQYRVKDVNFKTYSFDSSRTKPGLPNQNYCGSVSLYLLTKIRDVLSGTSIILNEVLMVMKSMPIYFDRKNTYPLGDLRTWFSSSK